MVFRITYFHTTLVWSTNFTSLTSRTRGARAGAGLAGVAGRAVLARKCRGDVRVRSGKTLGTVAEVVARVAERAEVARNALALRHRVNRTLGWKTYTHTHTHVRGSTFESVNTDVPYEPMPQFLKQSVPSTDEMA